MIQVKLLGKGDAVQQMKQNECKLDTSSKLNNLGVLKQNLNNNTFKAKRIKTIQIIYIFYANETNKHCSVDQFLNSQCPNERWNKLNEITRQIGTVINKFRN